jgi:predicted SAM-dependent methyltransferase
VSIELLNLGCGNRFHRDWVNVDFVSNDALVREYDLRRGIPYSDNRFNGVYHSHVLEHFTKEQGSYFIKECYRVLKPEGIVRVVVPDLEQIARNYLDALRNVTEDSTNLNSAAYEWSVAELLDQIVRESSGGEIKKIWSQETIINEQQIISRVGHEFISFRENYLHDMQSHTSVAKNSIVHSLKRRVRNLLMRCLKVSHEDLQTSRFKNCGECHKWMYDRHSLKALLISCGFKEVDIKTAWESGMPNWSSYLSLDVEDGVLRKPDSLYMEAIK